MKLHQLKHFLLIAETGNLVRAATHLGVTQPTLSRDLKMLEQELATRLFKRDGRGVSLTREGAAFRSAIAPHVAAIEAAKQQLLVRRGGRTGAIRLGWTGTISIPLGTRVIAAFTRQFPGVELHARGGSSLQVAEWIAREEIDLGVMNSEHPASGSLVEDLMRAPLHYVTRMEAEAPPTITFAEAAKTPLFVHSRQNALGRIVETCAREHDIALRIYAEVDDFIAIQPIICEGTGAAIVPRSLLVGGLADRLSVRRVTDPELTLFFRMAIAKARRRNPTALGLADIIRTEVRRAVAEGYLDGVANPS